MKVLQIFKTYCPDTVGGIETVIQNINSETKKLGVMNTLLTVSKNPRQDHFDDLPIIRLKKNFEIASCPFSFEYFRNFKNIAKNFDILHFHYPWPFADFTDILNGVNRPSLLTFHADVIKHPLLKTLYTPIQKRFLQKIDRIVPTSVPLMETSKDLKPFHDKCTVIPIGIDVKSYPGVSENKLREWKDKLGDQFLLFVGVLRHYKGIHTLLEAAKKIDIPIVIAGAGPLFEESKKFIHNANLSNVHLLGYVSEEDKVALYHLCKMVVLPSCSRAEAFGVSLIEGLMYKKPLISTELGTGTSFVNQNNKTGFVIPPENPQALIDAVTKLKSPTLAKEMNDAAYKWFLEEFQSDIMGKRYFELYKDLLK